MLILFFHGVLPRIGIMCAAPSHRNTSHAVGGSNPAVRGIGPGIAGRQFLATVCRLDRAQCADPNI
jgi:hypothetical protein